jgi:uncharacterized protein (TIGR02246 family)
MVLFRRRERHPGHLKSEILNFKFLKTAGFDLTGQRPKPHPSTMASLQSEFGRERQTQVPALALALWLIVLTFWTGCATRPPQAVPPPRNFVTEVTEELRRSADAWNSGNLDAFMAGYAEDATFALKDNFLQGRRAIREYYTPLFVPGARHGTLNLDQINVLVLSLDVVLVRGIYQNTQPGIVTRGATTLILRHSVNHWLIIHDHTN